MILAAFFFENILRARGNLFAGRFNAKRHNICKGGMSEKAGALIERCLGQVLSADEVRALTYWQDYDGKLSFLARKPGYPKKTAASSTGQNLLNLLHELGDMFPHLSAHVITDTASHPNGSGAAMFLAMLVDLDREGFMTEVQAALPRSITVNGKAVPKLLFNQDPHAFVNEIFIQDDACAAWRMAKHVSSGRIPLQLQRSQRKRPAAAPAGAAKPSPKKRRR